ncbi:DUF732 domain-containing protein [Mycolicibacter minnesotensis]
MQTQGGRAVAARARRCGAPALLGVALVIGWAGPASAEPEAGGGDAAFLASLRAVGLAFASTDLAIAAAHTVCGLVQNGETGLQVVKEVKAQNPELSMDGAAQFAALAANSYCPEQLAK